MTFLEMCKKVVEKCGISGTIASVNGQRGEMQRVVGWVNDAWYSIQLKNLNWRWMRYEFNFNTVSGVQEYSIATAGATRFRHWHTEGFRIQRASAGASDNKELSEMQWSEFRAQYIFGTQTPSAPISFAVRPRDNAILVGPNPNDIFVVAGEYQRAPYYLSGDLDVPDMPEEFHMMLVHAARNSYAMYENAPEIKADATEKYNAIYDSLVLTQLEEVVGAGPLA